MSYTASVTSTGKYNFDNDTQSSLFNYRTCLEHEIGRCDLYKVVDHGFPCENLDDIPATFRLLPRFSELSDVLGHSEALRQVLAEAASLRVAGRKSYLYTHILGPLLGIDERYDNVSCSERICIAREAWGLKYGDDDFVQTFEAHREWKNRTKELYQELAIALCDGIRNPPDLEALRNRPVRLTSIKVALKGLLKRGLPVQPDHDPGDLLKACLGVDIEGMGAAQLAKAVQRLNDFLVEHLDMYDDEKLRLVARIYFCLEPGYRGPT